MRDATSKARQDTTSSLQRIDQGVSGDVARTRPERWWPTVAAVFAIAVAFMMLGGIAVLVLVLVRLNVNATEPGVDFRHELYLITVLSSKSFAIVLPILATVLVTVLVWLAIPAAGTSADADRIRQVREVISQSSHLGTSAAIAWVTWATLLPIWAVAPSDESDPIDEVGMWIAWTLMPVVIVLGLCAGRFTGGDAKYRLDSKQAKADRVLRHLQWLSPSDSPDQAPRRTSWRWLRPRADTRRISDALIIAIPQVAIAFLVLPVFFLVQGVPVSALLPFVFDWYNVRWALVMMVVSVLTMVAVFNVLAEGGVTGAFSALLYGATVLAILILLTASGAQADADDRPVYTLASYFTIGVAAAQLASLLVPLGRRGNPLANFALRSTRKANAAAQRELASAREELDGEHRPATTSPTPRLLTEKEARRHLNVRRRTFKAVEKSGALPARQIGSETRYSLRDLDAFLESIVRE